MKGSVNGSTLGDRTDKSGSLPSLNVSIQNVTDILFNSTNNTGTDEPKEGTIYSTHQTEQLVTLWVLFAFIVVGNSLVLLVMWMERHKKTRMNFFIMNLALADLGAGLFNVLPDLVHRFTVEWIAGDFMCKLIKYIQGGVLYGSTYVLVALSVDRYDAIIHPMRFAHDRKSKAMICVAWGLAALFSIPSPVIFALTKMANGEWQCWATWPEDWYWTPYMTIVTTLVFFIPLVIISTCYAFIVVKIWRRSKELVQERKFIGEKCIPMTPRTFTQSNNKGSPDDPDDSPVKKRGCVGSLRGPKGKKIMRQPSSQGIIPKAKIKTIKLSLAIITAFIACWSPYFVFDMITNFSDLPESETKKRASLIIQNLPALNSAINPIIYGFFSTKNCGKFRRIKWVDWVAVRIFNCEELEKKGPGGVVPPRRRTFQSTLQETVLGPQTTTSSISRDAPSSAARRYP
ncbi:neuropeptide S receptor-like isoform X2 [Branchiostoma lanceolatum]|uniref:neuropeptide S receptor-like isoform X2 n=1 Tax=Branchiostoma lanceolatum TaxID=7740 RepID=UPI003451A489